VSCHVAALDQVRHKCGLLPEELVTKINNLYNKVSDIRAQRHTHSLPTSNDPRASLRITTDVLISLTRVQEQRSNELPFGLWRPHLSLRLTPAKSRLQHALPWTAFWAVLKRRFGQGAEGAGERSSNPVLEAAGLRLCWFSFPLPEPNTGYGWNCRSRSWTQPPTGAERDHRDAGTVTPWLSVGRGLPHGGTGWMKNSIKTGLAQRYFKSPENRGKAVC